MRILIVEDDERTASYLSRGLRESGFIVDRAANGELGLSLAGEEIYDLLVVDRLLPIMNGLDLVRSIRSARITMPVLMLSALATPQDRVEGLKAGCDDYLAKPYAFSELLARIEALARRGKIRTGDGTLSVGGFSLNIHQRIGLREGRSIPLQRREVLLLQTLMHNAGQIVTRAMLLEAAWDYDFEPRGNIVDMHIHRIRKKMDQGFSSTLIQTIAGAGYVFAAAEPSLPST